MLKKFAAETSHYAAHRSVLCIIHPALPSATEMPRAVHS